MEDGQAETSCEWQVLEFDEENCKTNDDCRRKQYGKSEDDNAPVNLEARQLVTSTNSKLHQDEPRKLHVFSEMIDNKQQLETRPPGSSPNLPPPNERRPPIAGNHHSACGTTMLLERCTDRKLEARRSGARDCHSPGETSRQAAELSASLKLICGRGAGARPLRQINIVGQLNHAACRGLLTLAFGVFALALLLARTQAALASPRLSWPVSLASLARPFGGTSGKGTNLISWPSSIGHHSLQANATGDEHTLTRAARHASTANNMASVNQQAAPSPPPLSQQFHYFWNHDKLSEQTLAEEAQKILAEAQRQTDKLAATPLNQIAAGAETARADVSATQHANATADLMSAGSSNIDALVPPAIQQQLTAMVLQMQRQQQLSHLMQPRFDGVGGELGQAGAAQRRLAAGGAIAPPPLINQRLWLAQASSQAPVLALAPPQLQQPSLLQARASLGGVPIYGPLLVAPSGGGGLMGTSPSGMGHFVPLPQAQLPQHNSMHNTQRQLARPHQHQQPRDQQQQIASRLASSLFGRHRKAWPLFGGGSSASQSERHTAAASQPRPTIAVPPPVASGAAGALPAGAIAAETARALALALPPESLALIESATNQLANLIVGQMQARSGRQQQLVAAMAAATAATAAAAATSQQHQLQGRTSDTSKQQQQLLQDQEARSMNALAGALADQMQASGSSNLHSVKLPDQIFSLAGAAAAAAAASQVSGADSKGQASLTEKQALAALQPPYLLNAAQSLLDTPAGLGLAESILAQLTATSANANLQHHQQASQNFDLSGAPNGQLFRSAPYDASAANSNQQHFGHRLKRRASLNATTSAAAAAAADQQMKTHHNHATVRRSSAQLSPPAKSQPARESGSLSSFNAAQQQQNKPAQVVAPSGGASSPELVNGTVAASWTRQARQLNQLKSSSQKQFQQKARTNGSNKLAVQSTSQAPASMRQQLLMIVATESPIVRTQTSASSRSPSHFQLLSSGSSEQLQGQTQLRRLKRASSGWKSMEAHSVAPQMAPPSLDEARTRRHSESPPGDWETFESKFLGRQASWLAASKSDASFKPMAGSDAGELRVDSKRKSDAQPVTAPPASPTSAAVLRRQAELTTASSVNATSAGAASSPSPLKTAAAVNQQQQQEGGEVASKSLGAGSERQDRALKTKRISSPSMASASMVVQQHAPMKTFSLTAGGATQQAAMMARHRQPTTQAVRVYSNLVPTSSAPPLPATSAMHTPTSGSSSEQPAAGSQISAASNLNNQLQAANVDPMAASLSESARVVNYFANVENEQPPQPAAAAKQTPPSATPAPTTRPATSNQQQASNIVGSPLAAAASTNSQPAINVGFGAPTKSVAATQLQQQQQASSAVKQQSQQAASGPLNSSTAPVVALSEQLLGPRQQAGSGAAPTFMAPNLANNLDVAAQQQQLLMLQNQQKLLTMLQMKQQQQQQQQQQQMRISPRVSQQTSVASPSLAPAASADISSAATGPLAYAVRQLGANGGGSPMSPSGTSGATSSAPGGSIQAAAAATTTTNGNQMQQARPLFGMAQGSSLLSTLLNLDPATRRSSSGGLGPTGGPSGGEQQQLTAGKLLNQGSLKGHTSISGRDRAPMADQFDEEFVPAPQPQGQPSGNFATTTSDQQPQQQQQQNYASNNGDSMGPASNQQAQEMTQQSLEQQQQFGGEQNFGARNSGLNANQQQQAQQQLADQTLANLFEQQQQIELARFNGQQAHDGQQQQQFLTSANFNQSISSFANDQFSSSGEVTQNGLEALNSVGGPSQANAFEAQQQAAAASLFTNVPNVNQLQRQPPSLSQGELGALSLATSTTGSQTGQGGFSSSSSSLNNNSNQNSALTSSASEDGLSQLLAAQSQAALLNAGNAGASELVNQLGTGPSPSQAAPNALAGWQSLRAALAGNRVSMQLEDAIALRNALIQSQLSSASSGGASNFYSPASGHEQTGASNLLQEAQQTPPASSFYGASLEGLGATGSGLPIDEEAAANAAAAAGIPTYPSAAQLLAIQAHGQAQALNSRLRRQQAALLMAGGGSDRSSSDGPGGKGGAQGGKSGKGAKSGKNGKKGGDFKHVSHHYHFNSLGSPLEDADGGQFAPPLGSLEFAGNIAAHEQAQANRLARLKQKQREQEEAEEERKKKQQQEEQEGEEGKAKRKRPKFLRRFSLKNLFKRLRKDKKEAATADEQQNEADEQSKQQEQQDGDSPSGNNSSPSDGQERAMMAS